MESFSFRINISCVNPSENQKVAEMKGNDTAAATIYSVFMIQDIPYPFHSIRYENKFRNFEIKQFMEIFPGINGEKKPPKPGKLFSRNLHNG